MANPTIERANLVRLLSTPNVAVVLVRTTIQGQIQVEAIGPGPLDRIRVLLSPNGTQNLIDFAPGSWWLNSTSLFSAVDNGFIDVITESSVQTGPSISLELQYIPQPHNPVIGDLLVFNGIGWDKLPAGPIGQVLTSNGPATVPSYQVGGSGSGSVTSVTALPPLSTSGTATDPVVEFQAWPANLAGALTNDGSGTLSWVPGGTGGIGGTIANTQVAFGTALDTIGGSAGLTWDGSTLAVDGSVDRATIGTLTIGGTTANAITVGKAGVTTSFPGPVALNGTVTSVTQTQFVAAAQFDGNVTFGNAVTDNVSFVSQIDTAITQEGIAAPAVSPLTTGRIYFDSGSNKFRVSQNNGAYVDMITGGTVTSVTLAASTTGLTVSGGASQTITSSGTFTLGGTLAVANGGTGTATAFTLGSVVFAGASGVYTQDNNNLFWDDTNNRLRIGFTFSGNLTLDSTTIALTTTAVCTVQVSFDLLVPSGTVVIDVDTAGSVIARYGTGVTGNTLASSLQAPATVAILTATATAGGGLTLPLGSYTTTTVASSTPNETLTVNGRVSIAEGTVPVPTTGFGKLWADSTADARPYWTDDTGQSYNLTLDRFNTLTYGVTPGSVAIDTSPALPVFNSLSLSQNTTFTTDNLDNGRSASVRVVGDASTRTLTFPSGPTGWTWLGSGPPASLAAGDVGYLSITAYGTADTDVVAAWSYENAPAVVIGSGVATQVAYFSSASTVTSKVAVGSDSFTWDATNNRLGVGTASPSTTLHVNSGAVNGTAIATLQNTAGDFQVFRVDANPEGSVTGSIGDIADDSTNGVVYVKTSGSATNTGWSPLAIAATAPSVLTLEYATSITLDFDPALSPYQKVTLAGDLTLLSPSANLGGGRALSLLIIGDGSIRTLTFPAWSFLGAAAPATLAAGKKAVLSLTSYGALDADVIAAYAAVP